MERRTRKATVRLTEEELARLKEAARRAGWSQEAYLRALIGGIDPRPKPPPDYLAMTRELHAIGNNLNQIARKAHALGTVDAAATTPRREGSKPRSARSWRRSKSREGGDEVAVTSIWKVEGRLARVLGYAGNPDKAEGSPDEWELQGVGAAILYAADPGKTERQLYVTGVNCLPATALEEMNATKRQYGKTGGIVAFHGYQAFAPGRDRPRHGPRGGRRPRPRAVGRPLRGCGGHPSGQGPPPQPLRGQLCVLRRRQALPPRRRLLPRDARSVRRTVPGAWSFGGGEPRARRRAPPRRMGAPSARGAPRGARS